MRDFPICHHLPRGRRRRVYRYPYRAYLCPAQGVVPRDGHLRVCHYRPDTDGQRSRTGHRRLGRIASPRLVSPSIPGYQFIEYYVVLAITIASLVVIWYIMKSRIGLAFLTIRENELEARLRVNPIRYRLLAFAMSAYLARYRGASDLPYRLSDPGPVWSQQLILACYLCNPRRPRYHSRTGRPERLCSRSSGRG